ncbi:TetR family transcriptional regulator [Rhodococcus pyridinivorans]|uniref:TetR family transcriptional regulator n=2 Tax=Rhodococcus TaxID=1827 RepID=UPI0009EF2A8C|nr:TetR family transcriptional regulator [Rhodococcus pyridinivorans]USI88537.1 TetR/AcrR family transcriptional regulator [Rhodococcus pyridinivorans]
MAGVRRRVRKIDMEDIIRVGRAIGLRQLSLNAVAAELGVSTTALYRHVDGRWGLELVVGESLLGDLVLHDDSEHDIERHLLSFGLQLRAFVLAHAGLGTYMQTLFPRGEAGQRLMVSEVEALVRRGYTPDVAVALASAVASTAINFAVAEEAQLERISGLRQQRDDVAERLSTDERLGEAHRDLPEFDHEGFSTMVLTATIRGLLAVGPVGRPLHEVVADLESTGMGLR